MNNPQNCQTHIIITGIIHKFKAKHKIALLDTITHIIRQLEGVLESICSLITAVLPTLPKLLCFQLEKLWPRKVRLLVQGHTAGQTSNLGYGFRSPSVGVLPPPHRKDTSVSIGVNEAGVSVICGGGEGQSSQGISSPRTLAGRAVLLSLLCYICMVSKHSLDQTTKD